MKQNPSVLLLLVCVTFGLFVIHTDAKAQTTTPIATNTDTPVPTFTDTPMPTNTPTPISTNTSTPFPAPTMTNTPTVTPAPTNTPAVIPTWYFDGRVTYGDYIQIGIASLMCVFVGLFGLAVLVIIIIDRRK